MLFFGGVGASVGGPRQGEGDARIGALVDMLDERQDRAGAWDLDGPLGALKLRGHVPDAWCRRSAGAGARSLAFECCQNSARIQDSLMEKEAESA